MSEPPARARLTVALAIVGLFVARFAVAAWFDPGRDGDIAWQQWLGLQVLHHHTLPSALGPETFTASGAPWVPQEWALGVGVALALGTPWYAVLVAFTTLAAACVLFVTALASRALGASTVPTAAAVTCVAFSMLESYGIRAQVFGWAALALLMYLLRCGSPRAKWWIVPLAALWANVHASAAIAPVLLGLWTAGLMAQERRISSNVRGHLLLTAASAGALLATPLGYRLPIYALQLVHSPIRSMINEWQPSSLSAISFTLGALALIVANAAVGFDRSRRWAEVFVFAAVTYLALTAVRNVPVCAIVIAPAVAARASRFLPERLRLNAIFGERPVLALLYCAAAVSAVFSGTILARSPEFRNGNLPQAAVAKLAAMPGTHRLYCEDFAWCSLALRYGNLREFIDGRADPFPLGVWQDYLTVFKANGRWRTVLNSRGVNAVLVDPKRALAREIALWHGWHLAYADERFRLFVRTNAARSSH